MQSSRVLQAQQSPKVMAQTPIKATMKHDTA